MFNKKKKEIELLKNSIETLKNEKETSKNIIAKLKKENATLENDNIELAKICDEKNTEIDKLKNKIKELEACLMCEEKPKKSPKKTSKTAKKV